MGKKIGDVRIIRRTLRGSGFLLVPNYEFLVGQSETFQELNKQLSPISIQLASAAYSNDQAEVGKLRITAIKLNQLG